MYQVIKNVRAYAKIKRNYTIGLSATPIRKKGQKFLPARKKRCGGLLTLTEKFELAENARKKWYMIHSLTQKRNGMTLGTMKAMFLNYQISCVGKKSKRLKMSKRIMAMTSNFFQKTVPVANPKKAKAI